MLNTKHRPGVLPLERFERQWIVLHLQNRLTLQLWKRQEITAETSYRKIEKECGVRFTCEKKACSKKWR